MSPFLLRITVYYIYDATYLCDALKALHQKKEVIMEKKFEL